MNHTLGGVCGFFVLPRPVNEAIEFQATTKRGEEAPRLAARTEK